MTRKCRLLLPLTELLAHIIDPTVAAIPSLQAGFLRFLRTVRASCSSGGFPAARAWSLMCGGGEGCLCE